MARIERYAADTGPLGWWFALFSREVQCTAWVYSRSPDAPKWMIKLWEMYNLESFI